MQPTVVADPADPRLADYQRLNDQRFRRTFEGDELFITEGYVAIARLLESRHRVRSVLLAPSRLDRFADRLPDLAVRGAPVYLAEPEVIAALVGFDLHRGVLAAADRRPLPALGELAARADRLAVLEGLNDPENLGLIARAARAFGIEGLVIDPTCTDPYSRRTVRVSMGEVLSVPVARAADWPAALDVLAEAGFETWAMAPALGGDDLWSVAVPRRVAVVFGAEGPGLDQETVGRATRRVRIPISYAVDSLNVGHAAAITFAALARPR